MIGLSRTLALALMLCLAGIGSAAALDYPVRAVKWVVPYPPGGTTDVIARIVSQWLSEKMGQPFLIENKAGGGSNIGVPKGTSAEIITKLNAETNRALADPGMQARLAELGGKPIAGTPQDFGKVIAAETAKWAKVVVASGAKVE